MWGPGTLDKSVNIASIVMIATILVTVVNEISNQLTIGRAHIECIAMYSNYM